MTGLVFVFFAERYGRNTVWENVLAAQVALLTIVLSIPVVALAILWMQQALGRAEEALELAHRDSLTGVFSRRALDELVDEAMRSASEKNAFVGIVYLDIDEFKLLNDSLGHAAGDAVLAELGQRLRQCLRSSDHAVRVGGDEFVVVVRDLKTSEDLEPIAASLRATFGKDFLVGGKLTPVKVSMGLCTSFGGEQPAALIARADEAMYRVKNH
jgi:diguanylate cyclase (GGDEF)-like protein